MIIMFKFLVLGAVAGWMMAWYEKHGFDRVLLLASMVEIGLFFYCVGLI